MSIAITAILILGILPATNLLGFVFPMQYTFIPIFTFILMFIYFGWVKFPKGANVFIAFWVLIILEVIFSGFFSPLLILGSFNFPTETIQYIARMLFFVAFIVVFYNYKIDNEKFFNRFLAVMLLGMCIAVFQFFNFGAISDFFARMYSYTDHHYQLMQLENLSSKRVSGVASHSTANGGLTAFTFVMIMSMYFFNKKKRLLTSIGLLLVVFNIVTAQARMGYLTVAFAVLVFYFVYNIIRKNNIKSTIFLIALICGTWSVLYWLYQNGNEYVTKAVMRWESLGEQVTAGENRIGQINEALNLLKTPWDYLFGISRGVENTVEGLFIEVEPVNIFVLYGGVGLALQYGLVFLLLVYFFRNFKIVKNYPMLLTMVVASFISLLSYQFFSAAYFFYRELHVGLFPWILMGATIGAVERFKKKPQEYEKDKVIMEVQEKKRRKRIVWEK